MGKLKIHKCQLYPASIVCCRGNQIDDLLKLVKVDDSNKKLFDESIKTTKTFTGSGVLVKDNSFVVYIVFNQNPTPIWLFGHEAVHVTDYIFDFIGAKDSINCSTANEPYAYLLGWVCKCMSESLGIE